MIQALQQQISDGLARKENARIFLEGLRSVAQGVLITQFDIRLWHTLVEFAKVMPNKTMIFHFRNGHEETVKLEEIQ